MEAWEHIAPELPPGWSLKLLLPACEEDNEPELISALEARGGEVWRGRKGECARRAWDAFGITRKRYAELIAVERVREAAGDKVSDPFDVEVMVQAQGVARIWVVCPVDARFQFGYGQGPTLCDAAWACIQALGGGE